MAAVAASGNASPCILPIRKITTAACALLRFGACPRKTSGRASPNCRPWRTWPRPETEEFYYHFNINPKKGEDLSEKQWETAGERARQQSRESQTQKALHHTEDSADIAAKRQRELDAHDRMMMRNSAEASRDALHDNGPGKEAGAYTVQEACDRAAHAPAVHRIEPDK